MGIGYGYSILKHVRESRSDEWVEFSRAGLYKTLDKLEKEGYVRKTFEQSGGRPPKKVYQITTSGNAALAEFLTSGFRFDYVTRNNLDEYLVTAVAATPDAAVLAEAVEKRIEAVRTQLDGLTNEWPEDKEAYPFIVYVLYNRRLESLKNELNWLSWVHDALETMSGDVLTVTWGDVRK